LRLVTSVDSALDKLVSRGFPPDTEAGTVREILERLQAMLHREIDEAEALQAAGEWTRRGLAALAAKKLRGFTPFARTTAAVETTRLCRLRQPYSPRRACGF
jgi:hypothetical protein